MSERVRKGSDGGLIFEDSRNSACKSLKTMFPPPRWRLGSTPSLASEAPKPELGHQRELLQKPSGFGIVSPTARFMAGRFTLDLLNQGLLTMERPLSGIV